MDAPAARRMPLRFDRIDFLRGLSILGVVLLHVRIFLGFAQYEVGQSFPAWLRYVVFNSGGNGVSVFFAISGFLITYISIRRFGGLRGMKLGRFYRIRFARIAPPLLLLLGILSVLHLAYVPHFHIRPPVGTLPQALFVTFTFQLNWFEAVHGWLPPNWTVLWSLSVEEMFYLFFPLLCVGLLRRRWGLGMFVSILMALVIFGPLARTPWYTTNNIWQGQSYLGNMDNVALGCLFAMLADRLGRETGWVSSRWPLVMQGAGAAMMTFIAFWMWPRVVLGWHVKDALGRTGMDVTVLGVGTCLVMLGSVLRPLCGSRWTAPIRWLGRYSYEVYLTHEFVVIGVLLLFLRVRKGPVALWICAVVILSGALGFLLARTLS
ncbi:MAG TPA: acyltransferase, partial [Acidobacteriaceae bacterium]|nr:acyltransferase [Acidobacteriaceae bacterium]